MKIIKLESIKNSKISKTIKNLWAFENSFHIKTENKSTALVSQRVKEAQLLTKNKTNQNTINTKIFLQ